MRFERRDAILVAGLLLFMIGLAPFVSIAAAAVIVTGMYFGIKVYVGRRRRSIEADVGEGLCMECGSRVSGGRCPACDGADAREP